MLFSDYLSLGDELERENIFDPILDSDSHFFINLQRLKKASTPEFQESYQRINEYFRKIIKLLDRAKSKSEKDICYRQALKMFDFSEVNGICLGYAKGTSGSGFGKLLGSQVISTAYDIVKLGIDDPEFFQLLPLFEDNVGADRLSDMIATLIIEDIEKYTKRINRELEITPENYKGYGFQNGFLMNPYKNDRVLLVPIEILHKLPVAQSWEDIDMYVSENMVIRAEMNSEVANEWSKYSSSERKTYLRNCVFKDVDACKRVIGEYRKEELPSFNPHENFDYFLEKLEQTIKRLGYNWKSDRSEYDSISVASDIISHFKHWVEYNKGWEVIQGAESRKREKILQRVIHLAGTSYIQANNLDMSCEPDEGRGPVDFKVSRGQDITIIEVKLSSNFQYLHGYEIQIEEYGKAEKTDKMIYVLVDLGNPIKIQKLIELHDRKVDEGLDCPEVVIIDSTKKESASIA